MTVEVIHNGTGDVLGVYKERSDAMWKFIESLFGRDFTLETVYHGTYVYNSANGDCFCIIETRTVV